MILHLRRRRSAARPAGRTYTGSHGNTVTVVSKTAIPLPADLGDGLDIVDALEDQRRREEAPVPAGPPWEGASATGQPEPAAGPVEAAWHHDTLTDIPPVMDRPYVPEPEPEYVPGAAYAADLEDDIAELTIFRDVVRSELIRRQAVRGQRDSRPWDLAYAAAYDKLWLDCDDLIWPGYGIAGPLRDAHAELMGAFAAHVDGLLAQMAGQAAAA